MPAQSAAATKAGLVCWESILLVLLVPLHGGALALVLALGLALVPTNAEGLLDRLLAGGVVRGNVDQVMGGTGLQTAELVDQGLTGCPG